MAVMTPSKKYHISVMYFVHFHNFFNAILWVKSSCIHSIWNLTSRKFLSVKTRRLWVNVHPGGPETKLIILCPPRLYFGTLLPWNFRMFTCNSSTQKHIWNLRIIEIQRGRFKKKFSEFYVNILKFIPQQHLICIILIHHELQLCPPREGNWVNTKKTPHDLHFESGYSGKFYM